MEEKKLTDEEIAKALLQSIEYSKTITYFDEWGNCKPIMVTDIINFIHRLQEHNGNQVRMRCDMQRKFDDLQILCTEQKAEIERLTEELDLANETIDRNNKRYERVSIERQKALDRVDYLEDALLDKIRRNEELITTIKQAEQQAVKDTAKEICDLILEHWGKKQFVECDWLRVAISEKYGVEVE